MRYLAILILSLVLIFSAGCTSNQDEELRSTIQDSLTPMQNALSEVSRDTLNHDYAATVLSGRALETESEIWYHRISNIDDISSEWQPVKMNYLRALDYFRMSGQKISNAGLSFQKGDLTSAITYAEGATADLDSGSRYFDEAMAAIPKK